MKLAGYLTENGTIDDDGNVAIVALCFLLVFIAIYKQQ